MTKIVLIAGSRKPKNIFHAKLLVDEMVAKLEPGMVVLNGGAPGIDTYVLDAVRRRDDGDIHEVRHNDLVQVLSAPGKVIACVYRPNYKLHGRRYAPIARNLHMLDLKPDFVVVLWNGESPGSRQVSEEAARRGIEHQVIVT